MSQPGPQIVPQQIPLGKRRLVQASTTLLAEWCALYHPSKTVLYEHRLGPVPQSAIGVQVTPAIARMLARSNSYADALIVDDSQLLVVEAKVIALPGAISQVVYYSRLVPQTIDLAPYRALKVTALVLSAVDNPIVAAMANEQGVLYQVYSPQWISDYLNSKYSNVPATLPTG